jgi:hypothetical protein
LFFGWDQAPRNQVSSQERRRDPRRTFNLPVRVQGHDPNGAAWEEMTQSEDACFGGVALPLKHPVFVGQALFLSLPLPKAFRQYSLSDATYRVYALVRAVALPPINRVGVMFLGKHPPRGYEANPGGRYLMPNDPPPAPKERRILRRVDVYVNLRLVRSNGTVQAEQTVTENLSRGGVRIMTSLPVEKGEVVVIEDPHGSFSLRAEARNVFVGKDGIPRVNLRFVDGSKADALIAASGLAANEF